MSSDYQPGSVVITGTGVATATASLAASLTARGYVQAVFVDVAAGTATLCRVEIRNAAAVVLALTFPVTGGQVIFPAFIPITAANAALNIVATTTGATTTNVYAVVSYGP